MRDGMWVSGRGALLALLIGLAPPTAEAETLREALARAYETNPRLGGGRDNVRAVREETTIARALGRQTARAGGSVGQDFRALSGFDGDGRLATLDARLDIPLFRGGLITSSLGNARSLLSAAELDLVALENDVLTAATAAYEDVRRDTEVVELNRNNLRVLNEQLRASRDRFEVGDLTRTDVAQSEARVAFAESQLRQAEAQLVASMQAYERVIGTQPGALQPPPPLGWLPASSEEAVALTRTENPLLLAAKADAEAARYRIGIARSERRPSLFASGSTNYVNFLGSANAGIPGVPSFITDNDYTQQSVGVTLSVPIYTGGAASARVRQAQARRSQAEQGITETDRAVVEQARNAYEALIAARSVIQSAEAQVRANEIALEGVRAEQNVGLRQVLDVLNAEQELLNARVELVRARRTEYVAGFALLAAIGRATAANLELDVAPAGTAAALMPPPAAGAR